MNPSTLSTILATRGPNKKPPARSSEFPKADSTGPGAGADGGISTPIVLVVADHMGFTIELLPDRTTLRFTKDQSEPFELTVATEKSLTNNSTVEVMETGRLLYKFKDGTEKRAKVRLGATPDTLWCQLCGQGRCGKKQHKLSEELRITFIRQGLLTRSTTKHLIYENAKRRDFVKHSHHE